MKLLLDTQVFLWSIDSPRRLSGEAAAALLDGDNDLFLSAASYWEICLKLSIGKLALQERWAELLDREMSANRIVWLALEKQHMRAVVGLPWVHRDPFDRLLVAQARCEGMAIVTSDENLRQYGVGTVW
ncbi:MAG: type II toxin-antitoxin system VapC family toxin [Spirochaetales bacterium]|nr:type II toxin-antitoxin system VapC family toxin [Spirochaetales bacterium]